MHLGALPDGRASAPHRDPTASTQLPFTNNGASTRQWITELNKETLRQKNEKLPAV